MNQQCKVCGEPAAGFHFGAFTCEGCKPGCDLPRTAEDGHTGRRAHASPMRVRSSKGASTDTYLRNFISFFGRSYNNLGSITECKNNGECVINKKNRTACKACRLRKCLLVGMSKSGSRYGRRSNWFKIHCLLQEQQQAALAALQGKSPADPPFQMSFPPPSVSSPDSESSDSPFFSLPFPSVFMRPPPFLLHPQMFPFPPTPPLKPPDEDIKPINNNYVSKNENLKDPKRFYLDAILGLKKEAPSPPAYLDTPPLTQEDPIDLSVRSRLRSIDEELKVTDRRSPSNHEEMEEARDLVHGLQVEDSKVIPLDLSV